MTLIFKTFLIWRIFTMKKLLVTGLYLAFSLLSSGFCHAAPDEIHFETVSMKPFGIAITAKNVIVKGSGSSKKELSDFFTGTDPEKQKKILSSFKAQSVKIQELSFETTFTFQMLESMLHITGSFKELNLNDMKNGIIKTADIAEFKSSLKLDIKPLNIQSGSEPVSDKVKLVQFDLLEQGITAKDITIPALTGTAQETDERHFWKKWFFVDMGTLSIADETLMLEFNEPQVDYNEGTLLKGNVKNLHYTGIHDGRIDRYDSESETHFRESTDKETQILTQTTWVNESSSYEELDLNAFFEILFLPQEIEDAPFKILRKSLTSKNSSQTQTIIKGSQKEISQLSMETTYFGPFKYRLFQQPPIEIISMLLSKNGSRFQSPMEVFIYCNKDILNNIEFSGYSLKVSYLSDRNFNNPDGKEDAKTGRHQTATLDRIAWGPGLLEFKGFEGHGHDDQYKVAVFWDQISFSDFSFTPTIATMEHLTSAGNFHEELAKAGMLSSLIPKIGQFDIRNLKFGSDMDTDPMLFSLEALTLRVDEQTYGIPSKMQIQLTDLVSDKEFLSAFLPELKNLDLDTIRVSMNADENWSRDTEKLLMQFAFKMDQIGSFSTGISLNNIPEEAFALKDEVITGLLYNATIQNLNLEMTDAGGFERGLKALSAFYQKDPDALKSTLIQNINMATAFLPGGRHKNVSVLVDAVKTFIQAPGTLNISIDAISTDGVGLSDILRANNDIPAMLDLVDVKATAQ